MLHIDLEQSDALATLRPEGALTEADFEHAANMVDQYIDEHGALRGLIINSRHFEGWDSFSAMLQHLRFVREHHARIGRVALVTDSPVGQLGEKLADHFVAADIRSFPFDDLIEARRWVARATPI